MAVANATFCSRELSGQQTKPLRVHILQPALPAYRVPVFAELARRTGLSLKVCYGKLPDLSNVSPQGFDGEHVPQRIFNQGRYLLFWHAPQWTKCRRSQTDVLVLSWNLRYLLLIPALIRARIQGIGTVLWGHGYSKQEARWRRWLRDRVGRLATATMFYNHTAAKRYIDDGANADSVFVALNSLDQTPIQQAREHWLSQPEKLAAFRQEKGLNDGPVILFVSRFDPDNRLDLLLRAAVILKSKFPTLKIALIGKGEPEMTRLKEMTQELGLQDQVIFAGAIYEQTDVAPWFLCSQVFCYPANIGLSILHAFGYGLPVVTSDAIEQQNPEIEALRDGYNGLLYAHNDAPSLAAALDRLLSNPELQKQMAEQALQTVQTRFSVKNMVDGIEAAIRYAAAHA